MKTGKKGLIAALIAVSSLVALSACSAAPAAASSTGAGSAAASSTEASSAAASSAAASSGAAKVLKVGASPAPHAEILEFVKDQLKEKGIDLQIVEFTDYVLPNNALDSGELDANYFQHKPYLDDFNTKNGTKLASAAAIHFQDPEGMLAGQGLQSVYSIPVDGAMVDGACGSDVNALLRWGIGRQRAAARSR